MPLKLAVGFLFNLSYAVMKITKQIQLDKMLKNEDSVHTEKLQ